MGDTKIARRAFNAGEVSKSFKWRNDVEKHAFSCERLENFYVNTLGGISRREGTRFLAELGEVSHEDDVRLIPFEYNRELSLVLALHSADGRIWAKTNEFRLNAVCSICMDIPAGFAAEGAILKKGALSLIRAAGGVYTVSTAASMASVSADAGAHKIVLVFYPDKIYAYVDGVLADGFPKAFAGAGTGEDLFENETAFYLECDQPDR